MKVYIMLTCDDDIECPYSMYEVDDKGDIFGKPLFADGIDQFKSAKEAIECCKIEGYEYTVE
jgi:hypothetical protein